MKKTQERVRPAHGGFGSGGENIFPLYIKTAKKNTFSVWKPP